MGMLLQSERRDGIHAILTIYELAESNSAVFHPAITGNHPAYSA
jgi:hypothetical protein